MPELPEVETVVRDLRPLLTGRTIVGVRHSKKKLRRPWKADWNAVVSGAKISGVRRRGKWILVDLQRTQIESPPTRCSKTRSDLPHKGGGSEITSPLVGEVASREAALRVGGDRLPSDFPLLRIHLGMSGQFTVVPANTPEQDHVHVVFALDNNTELRLRDPRRFGAAEYFPSRATLEIEMNAELGPEPFGMNADTFRAAVTATSRNLKAVLLDQTIVAGVGNIYADEALFRAKLHPARTGKSLKPDECDRLRVAIEEVMTRAIESRGSTIRDYVGGSGLRGGFQNEHAVYGRTDEPCPTCGTLVKCVRLAGRSSHFCPLCQQISTQRHKVRTKTHKEKS